MTNVYITKSGFIEDKTIFNHFKDIAAIVSEEDIGSIDEGLEIIIYLLNKFPGIATRWACTGHPDRADSDDFHIITVVHDQASFDILEDIIHQYNLKLSPRFNNEEGDDFRKHLRIIKHGMLMCQYNGQPLTYPVVSIESWCGTITDDFHLKLLRDVVLIKLMQYDSCDLFFGSEQEEVKELQLRQSAFERVEEMFNTLYDILSDFRMGTHPREDRQAIIKAIIKIEEFGDYLNDENREELSRIKEEINSN